MWWWFWVFKKQNLCSSCLGTEFQCYTEHDCSEAGCRTCGGAGTVSALKLSGSDTIRGRWRSSGPSLPSLPCIWELGATVTSPLKAVPHFKVASFHMCGHHSTAYSSDCQSGLWWLSPYTYTGFQFFSKDLCIKSWKSKRITWNLTCSC